MRKQPTIRNLDLVVTAHWFEEIRSGRKRTEYRKISPHWQARLRNREYDTVTIRRGYTQDKLVFQWGGNSIIYNDNDLGVVPAYAITLGDIVKPYLYKIQIGTATLYLGDYKDIIPTLNGIAVILTDPPYGISYKSGYATEALWKGRDSIEGDKNEAFGLSR